jgi:hypothetical protein
MQCQFHSKLSAFAAKCPCCDLPGNLSLKKLVPELPNPNQQLGNQDLVLSGNPDT